MPRLMPVYDPAAFTRLVLVGVGGAAFFWFISVVGEERRSRRLSPHVPEGGGRPAQDELAAQPSIREAVSAIWANPRARRYAIFLAVSAFFAFMQDAILEPFGGDVFGLAVGQTTRFNAYWGTGVIVGMVGTLILTRRRRPDQQVSTTSWGLVLLGLPLLLLGAVALREALPMVMPTLIFFGLGFGIFTVGGVSLLMAVNQESQAGTYLALWSVIQLISRGAGIAAGGIVRDVALSLTGSYSAAYAAVFIIEAGGLFVSIWLLQRVGVAAFASKARVSAADVLAAAD